MLVKMTLKNRHTLPQSVMESLGPVQYDIVLM